MHAASLGPSGAIPRVLDLFTSCYSCAHFPMITRDSTHDHMQFCMAITWEDRPNVVRFDPRRVSHINMLIGVQGMR